ncbi:LytR C-terminal domain-containing protein [Dermacoccaceae bacterium W4C1]
MSTARPATGFDRARARRRRRANIVLVIAGLLVIGGLGWAIAVFGDSEDPLPEACTAPATTAPQAMFTTNVYNSTGGSGEAGTISNALRSRGLQVGVVGNDPYKKKLAGVGEIRFGPQGKQYAERYIVPLVPGATLAPDGRTGTSVDVVIASSFPAISSLTATSSAGPAC